MVRSGRLRIDGDRAPPRRNGVADENEVAAIGRLRIRLRVYAEGRHVRPTPVHQRPCVAIRGKRRLARLLDLAVSRVIWREIEVAGKDRRGGLRRGVERAALGGG